MMSDDLREMTRDPLLTAAEVARWLRVDRKTISRWVINGALRSITTPGGQHRFRLSDVEDTLTYE